jgi:hypothetical protein
VRRLREESGRQTQRSASTLMAVSLCSNSQCESK